MKDNKNEIVSFRISSSLHEKLKQKCSCMESLMLKATGRSIKITESAYVESVIREDLEKPCQHKKTA